MDEVVGVGAVVGVGVLGGGEERGGEGVEDWQGRGTCDHSVVNTTVSVAATRERREPSARRVESPSEIVVRPLSLISAVSRKEAGIRLTDRSRVSEVRRNMDTWDGSTGCAAACLAITFAT